MQKTRLKLITLLTIAFIAALAAAFISLPRGTASAEESSYGYYYSQLTTSESKAFYTALADMREDDVLKTGTETWDLVERHYLENKEYAQSAITSAFGAGRDAFMLDNPDLFYVNFDNLSVRMTTDGTNYKITLGIGREESYLADGFSAETIDGDIAAYNSAVNAIVEGASVKTTLYDKILYVYETIMDNAIYTLEFAAGNDADYVRCAYGVMVKGKGVCQSFSQAVKAVLDRLNITCVLVEGTYIYDGEEQSHMWNYVNMDDGRWYILDATMDNSWRDAGTADSLRYFLLNGTAAAGLYAPDGVISTSDFEFTYPSLCLVDYTQPSVGFTFKSVTSESGTYYYEVSYNGMGLQKAAEAGYYLLATYDVNGESGWFYLINYINVYIIPNSDGDINDYDGETCFSSKFLGTSTSFIFGVTTDAPGEDTLSYGYLYIGSSVLEKSAAVISDSTTIAPYAVTVSPDSLRFYIGSTYSVTVTYSDNLVKVDDTLPVTLTYSVPEGVTLSAADKVLQYTVCWSESAPNQITFTFTPDKNYSADRCDYTFTLSNLVGESSGKAPVTFSLTALYKPSFSCPVNPLSYCTAVASVPQLISDSDLSVEGWEYVDENGETQTVSSSSLSNKISLVATTYSDEANAQYQSAVEEYNTANGSEANILSSATYDLSLNLCDMQVSYLNGNRVMVMVPFPEGYSAESSGVSFKAYHFASNGEIEEIDCYCTEYGIILFCESFSNYTVAAVEGESNVSQKTVLLTSEGNGSISTGNLVTVADGDSLTVKITAATDYCIDSITVNGTVTAMNGATEYDLVKEYGELDDNTTIIVTFAAASVVSAELSQGNTISSASEGETSSPVLLIVLVSLCILIAIAAIITCAIILKKRRTK